MYIETKLSYNKTLDNGAMKKATQSYLVDAQSFTEAEARTYEKAAPFIVGDFTIEAVKKTRYAEIFEGDGDKYYRVKAAFITIDERTATEKKRATNILVQADTVANALEKFNQGMEGTLADYEITAIAETQILDILRP